jgi:hypothetical protein
MLPRGNVPHAKPKRGKRDMRTTPIPATKNPQKLVNLALDAAAECYLVGTGPVQSAATYILGSILHVDTTPAREAILERVRELQTTVKS